MYSHSRPMSIRIWVSVDDLANELDIIWTKSTWKWWKIERRTGDDFGVEGDIDEMHSALRRREVNPERGGSNRTHVIVHGWTCWVRYSHF